MMSFIHKVHGQPRLHVSANLLFGAWPPCRMTPPLSLCTPASNTASHDNHDKINSWVSFTFYGYGAQLGFGRQGSAITVCLPVVHSFHLRYASRLFCYFLFTIINKNGFACVEGVICEGVFVASHLRTLQAYDWAKS